MYAGPTSLLVSPIVSLHIDSSCSDVYVTFTGDEIVEWNGVCLRNKTDAMVQDIISRWGGEIEITVRLDKQPYKLPRHQKR